ncbi:hypothetical protein M404DRAFT_36533 [Pisolithus tinctorius Marx 270]|uniref:Uncharacterized protein n=1 Tax=Pisolithus tinctorius Marx 270 TaxID=870435 RepID=A0A0C3NBM0_PISTI|nr:hypothetical protein M404DRAFT_36539 [Pisolithus tinctorius Marx 270]KIN92963.1 hypothetical protein M404DRAFT_36533 [Pisolithus tinctorius Marx 270]
MSTLRPTTTANNNSEGQAMIDWTQVSDDAIKYDTDNEEEMMRAKAKERKWHKVAEQAQWEEQAQLEAKRAEREKAKAERAAQEAEQERAHKEEEKCRAEEEKEADCTCCAQAQVVCKFLVDGNKKRVACMCCNQSKGKCQWSGDGKDAKAGPKATTKADKGKKWKADEESPEPGPSQKKQVKSKLTEVLEIDEPKDGGSRVRKTGAGGFSGLEDKLEQLIDVAGLIAKNLAGLFELQEATVKHSGCIADALKSLLDESYGYRMVVSPSDLGSSELDSDKLCKEAEWLKAHGKDREEETKGEDEAK